MFKQFTNSLAEQLRPIAAQNAVFMRQQAAQAAERARTKRDERYVNQIERQAVRWQDIAVDGPVNG